MTFSVEFNLGMPFDIRISSGITHTVSTFRNTGHILVTAKVNSLKYVTRNAILAL